MCKTVTRAGHVRRISHVTKGERTAIMGGLKAAYHDHPEGPILLSVYKRVVGELQNLRCPEGTGGQVGAGVMFTNLDDPFARGPMLDDIEFTVSSGEPDQ